MKRRRLELPRNNFHYPLKVARLPIPPPGHWTYSVIWLFRMLSGKRGSNPRPRPWQGRALPTELLPHCSVSRSISLNASAKVQFIFETTNFSEVFFQKNAIFLFHIIYNIWILPQNQPKVGWHNAWHKEMERTRMTIPLQITDCRTTPTLFRPLAI